MPDRDGYIPGVPCWVDTTQPEPEASLEFYRGIFGWEIEDVMPAEAPGHYFIGRIRGRDVAALGSLDEGAPPMAMWNTYIWVDSVDATIDEVKAAGGQVVAPAFDVMASGRMAVVADPEGAVFCLWEAREHKGARVVNEHGSLNFNTLATRDLDKAKAFYGDVFGWTLLDLAGSGMWMLPGYGDHLEESTPGLRDQMAAMGAPDGFVDVVAAVKQIADPEGDTSPHWSVTFSVDDVDAVAAKAAELGGEVLVAPFDAPWVRMAVLRDPQGATFIASQFVMENSGLTE